MTDVMISTNGLSKHFGAVRALDNVNFEVTKGEVVGFLGPNGAGKSTTMRILTCFISPTSGSAKVPGTMSSTGRSRFGRSFGYLPQRAPLHGHERLGVPAGSPPRSAGSMRAGSRHA
jgi:ABC-2 type transport system ATP-binding protein